jgi:3-oxoacyl-[acyl-carrier protein] reductase
VSETLVESRPAGTVAIVTGASRGVGRELVLELSRRGCAVVAVYLRSPAAAEAVVQDANRAGGTALTLRADVTDGVDVERLFDEAVAAFGLVDIVVHAARVAARELVEQSLRRLRRGGIVLSIPPLGAVTRALGDEIRASGVTVRDVASPACRGDASEVLEPLLLWLDPHCVG